MMCGKVWLVGAGPGDAGLLTIKADRVLSEADVIVYDHLAGRDILMQYAPGKKLIDVGKMAGSHPVPQDQINDILAAEAKQGRKVVRLKGGDPFLFGRGGEELERLLEEGIPFEVVPGVTSAIAVAAYNGIPVTHRDFSSSLHVVTGHVRKGKKSEINYQALVEGGGTLVFLMGVGALPEIMRGLLEAGMPADTPAAILQEGTTARQRKVTASVATLEERARDAQIRPPAIIIVGKVCALSEKLDWYKELPLAGMRVLLTRPKELISVTAEKLRKKGAEVLEIPTIETVPVQGALKQFPAGKLEGVDWIVFTSQVGVRVFFEKLREEQTDIRSLHGAKFAVIGEGTKRALAGYGIYADVMPKTYDGEHLARALAERGIEGARILVPRAKKGNELLVPILEKAGAKVFDLPIYETLYREDMKEILQEEFESGRIDCAVFTSSSTVEGFVRARGAGDFGNVRAACIGRKTADTAKRYGMQTFVAQKETIDSVIELVESMRQEEQSVRQEEQSV